MHEAIKKQNEKKINELLGEMSELREKITDRDNELKLAYGRITTLERSIAAYKGWQTRRDPNRPKVTIKQKKIDSQLIKLEL